MKTFLVAIALLSIAGTAMAAGKPCAELKSEIDAKISAAGATSYSLDVVEKGRAASGKVVGTCDCGGKEIVYTRG